MSSEATESPKPVCAPYVQNRELSWLEFNKRVLDQGADPSVPLLERLQFVSIFTSNLEEFFMVRVGSLTDLALINKEIRDSKSKMTPNEQLDAIHDRCHELYPIQEQIYNELEASLFKAGVHRYQYSELNESQREFVANRMRNNVFPFLTPQIINARHPFPHLESGGIYIVVRLTEMSTKKKSEMTDEERKQEKEERKRLKNLGAEGVTLGIIPLPKQANRIIELPGKGYNYILLEDALEASVSEVFSMYNVKHTNIICVTRNADLDATEGADERDDDYREHMKKILKKRSRLAPVRLESRRKLSETVGEFLMTRLDLKPNQVFTTCVPLNMSYAFALPSMVGEELRSKLTSTPFAPAWPAEVKRNARIIDQVQDKELLFSYPYESMDPFVQLLREASVDPDVVSIKITLYRLASQSHLAEALIAAADAGKEVTALFELRARFDESNNIRWSQRFEEAGCNVIYGFHDYKVHSKICSIVRRTADGVQTITQLGTGNYNEKTARLYTDFSFITTDPEIGKDAAEFFRNMGMESASRAYCNLCVAPLQIKQRIFEGIDQQIALAKAGEPSGLFFKTNSITDKQIIEKLVEASQAGVPTTLLIRGISCIVPGVEGYTENIRVVSIVGRLLEHSRIYGFGPHDEMQIYLSSADLMTRNMDKRVEIAWPILNEGPRKKVLDYIDTCLADTAKLRELKPNGTFTELGDLASRREREKGKLFNAQETLIASAKKASDKALEQELSEKSAYDKLSMQANAERRAAARERSALTDLEEIFREALQHEMPAADDEALQPFLKAVKVAARTLAENAAADVEAASEATNDAPENERIADAADIEQPVEEASAVGAEPSNLEPEAEEAAAGSSNEEDASCEAAEAEPQVSETEPANDSDAEADIPAQQDEPAEPESEKAAEPADGKEAAKEQKPAAATATAKAKPTAAEAKPAPKKKGFFSRLFNRK